MYGYKSGTVIVNMSHFKEELSDQRRHDCGGTPSTIRLGGVSVALVISLLPARTILHLLNRVQC